MKVVINTCFGGFSLSDEAFAEYKRLGGTAEYSRHIDRSDTLLVQVVENMGEKADGFCAELKVVEIPDGIKWTVEEYDGREWIAEVHRTWD